MTLEIDLQTFRTLALNTLKSVGAATCSIHYEGAAGYARIEGISLYSSNDTLIDKVFTDPIVLEIPTHTWADLDSMLVDFTTTVLAYHHHDNTDETSYGTLTIDVAEQQITLERCERVVQSSTISVE